MTMQTNTRSSSQTGGQANAGTQPRVTPFLWFDDQAEEAANQYVSIFSDLRGRESGGESKVLDTTRYSKSAAEVSGRPEGSAMTVRFLLDGQEFTALNGGPEFRFTEAVSFVVSCGTQEEVDGFWTRLSEGGEEGPCGWLKDRYGLSWQVVPKALGEMLSDPDAERSERAMAAMLQMKKLDIEALRRAHEGR
jgi:predicted 3-demethylubiquinone-9 3-methyltransferase (glyoxalase superfamily)